MNYSHMIEIDEGRRRLVIFRIYDDGGRKELYTYVDLPDISFEKDKEKFHDFARILGENLLVDSPIARKLFNL